MFILKPLDLIYDCCGGDVNERLKAGMTAKSNNEAVGGKQAHFLVGIAYQKGVPGVFAQCSSQRFLQDGAPFQNSAFQSAVMVQ